MHGRKARSSRLWAFLFVCLTMYAGVVDHRQRQADQDRIRREIREGARPPLARRLTPEIVQADTDALLARIRATQPQTTAKQHLLPSPEELLEEYVQGQPGLTYAQMAEAYDVSPTLIGRLVKRALPPNVEGVKEYIQGYAAHKQQDRVVRRRVAEYASHHGPTATMALLATLLAEIATTQTADTDSQEIA